MSYYNATRQLLQSVLDDINITDLSLFDSPEGVHEFAGSIYDRTVIAIQDSAVLYIPKHKKGYYKFWWNQELDLLKEKARIKYGRPQESHIRSLSFGNVKLAYKIKIREGK